MSSSALRMSSSDAGPLVRIGLVVGSQSSVDLPFTIVIVATCVRLPSAATVKYAATYLYINDVYVVRPKLP